MTAASVPAATPGAPPPPRAAGKERHRGLSPYLFLAPYVLVTACFTLYPLVNAAVLAFHQTNGPASRAFVGIDNFRYLLNDPLFYQALWNTTVFAACSVLIQLPLSMGLALLLNSGQGFARGLFRLILFSPNLVGQIFVGVLFSVLFTPRYGLVNRFFHELTGWGLDEQWLNDPALVMPAIVICALWVYVGFNMIYFLAALQSVDKSLEEAARVDGANRLQVFWHVTLPSMRHVVVFVVVTSLIGSYQLFELPLALFALSNGKGPDNSALTLISYLYDTGFLTGDLGLGSAVGWVVAVIIFTLSLAQLRVARVLEDA
jgi:ABC-type sugar transport system permease subunit